MTLPTADLNILAKAVNSSSSSVIITDNTLEDHPIIFCNPAFEKMSGYSYEEIIGKNCRFLQADDSNQSAKALIRRSLENGSDCEVFIRNYRKDGSIFLNELFLSPVKNSAGETTHFIGVQKDITGQMTGRDVSRDFTNFAKHELGTPLTIIKSTLQLLQRGGQNVDPDFLNKSIAAALLAVKRLEDLGKNHFN